MVIQSSCSPSPRLALPWRLALVIALLVGVTLPQPAHAAPAWTAVGSMSATRYLHTATLLPNGKVLVAGGCNDDACTGALSSAEVYDPSANTWTAVASMNTPRRSHTATLMPNGKVLVAGGYNGGTYALIDAEVYDPEANTWTTVALMNTFRDAQTATLLPDGRVLVAGGYGINSGNASAEVYDPTAGTWTLVASMHSGRASHAATLLPGGKVLVTGGYSGVLPAPKCMIRARMPGRTLRP
jgi:N-acetylneuraminic acid mutarotase